jgi:peptide/nickel transport system ATP-binding protein
VGESGSGKASPVFILGMVDAPGRIVGGEILFQGRDLVRMDKTSCASCRATASP